MVDRKYSEGEEVVDMKKDTMNKNIFKCYIQEAMHWAWRDGSVQYVLFL